MNRKKGNKTVTEEMSLFSSVEINSSSPSKKSNLVCFTNEYSKRRSTQEASEKKSILNTILKQADKLNW